jgi:hypothetical protein
MADENLLDDDIESIKISQGSTKVASTGKEQSGFSDPTRVFPKQEYLQDVTTNKAARGHFKNDLDVGGGAPSFSLELNDQPNSEYPLNEVKETVTGHVIEIDDTKGTQRILIKHRTGSGVELRSDGTVLINATHNTVRVTGNDEKVIVEGDGELIYNGNLKLTVAGDFDLDVKGNYNVRTGGNRAEVINGSYKQVVERNHDTTVKKNKLSHVLGVNTLMQLNDYHVNVKGNQYNRVQGNADFFVSDTLTMTAKEEVVLSSQSANITASSMTLMGDSGVIGGTEIIMYGRGGTFEEGVTAPTFHGDLQGTATQAIDANQSAKSMIADELGEGAGTGGHSASNTSTPILQYDGETIKPNTDVVDDILNRSDRGYRRVQVDIGDVLRNKIDKTEKYGGVATRPLTTEEVRSKLRDPKNYTNNKFVGAQIAEGKLSPTYVEKTHPNVGRIVKNQKRAIRGRTTLGSAPLGPVKRVST